MRISAFYVAAVPVALAIGVGLSFSADEAVKVERLSPEVNQLISQGAKLERLCDGFKWTEGPVWIHSGYLLFAEIPSNSIRKWIPGQTSATIFMLPSGYKGSTPYGGPESGSNGMTLDAKQRLTVAGHAQRDVYRAETMNPSGQITILADSYDGKRFNSPNDLVYRSNGDLYFTDPPYGLRTQSDKDPEKELSFNGVYRLPGALSTPSGTPPDNTKLQVLIKDLPRPNGIAFSPDEKYLYVNNSEPNKIWMRYPVNGDGSVGPGAQFADATSDSRPGAPDGMKVDSSGNIYSAAPGGVWIFNAEGTHIGTIDMPERTGNLAWGDSDWKSLYICASSSVYRLRTNATGMHP